MHKFNVNVGVCSNLPKWQKYSITNLHRVVGSKADLYPRGDSYTVSVLLEVKLGKNTLGQL